MTKEKVYTDWMPKLSLELEELDVQLDKKKVFEEWLPELEREYGSLCQEYIDKKTDAQDAKARMKFVRKIAKPLGSKRNKDCIDALMYESLKEDYVIKQQAFRFFDKEKGTRIFYLKYLITGLVDALKALSTENSEIKSETRADVSSLPLQKDGRSQRKLAI
jgi:hypothetical protein